MFDVTIPSSIPMFQSLFSLTIITWGWRARMLHRHEYKVKTKRVNVVHFVGAYAPEHYHSKYVTELKVHRRRT